ncbi:helix-turn-helix domain-containing protein [Oceanobacillus locisalsi]|uniref:Helix-turn-helix domain-containing protein n=1 Tax=Oceanobacillus locisalsi TaxID=546107 RepID=A0ABW3NJ26_9BACI
MDNILGKRIKSLRDAKDIKQKQVADSLGISPYQLSRYESGKSKPDPELIVDIATFFDVSADYLLGRNAEENKFDYYKNKIVTEFPDIDLMFHDMESLTAEDLKEVYEFIKFKKSQNE